MQYTISTSITHHLTANHTTILEEAFNLEVPIRLPQMKPPRLGSDATKYCRYHRGIGHNTEDCWALKDKLEELIQAGYLAQFVKRSDNHQAGPRPGGHLEEQHKNQEADRRRAED